MLYITCKHIQIYEYIFSKFCLQIDIEGFLNLTAEVIKEVI